MNTDTTHNKTQEMVQGGTIPEDNIYYKIDLNIPEDNIHNNMSYTETKTDTNLKVKKKKIIKSKIKKKKIINNNEPYSEGNNFLERGYNPGFFGPAETKMSDDIQPWMNQNSVLWFPTKMSKKDTKAPDKQTLSNGRGMDGYIKKENKKGVEGFWATPNDFKLYTKEEIQKRQTDKNLAVDRTIITHDCGEVSWIDVDTSFYDSFIAHLIAAHPHYTSMSGKEGRVHIPFIMDEKPEFFPTTFMGVGEKCRHKCYYMDEVSEKADKDKKKIEIYTGGWLYCKKDTKIQNYKQPIPHINYTKFTDFILKKKKKSSTKKKKAINHMFATKKMDKKTEDMFIAYSKVIKPEIWNRSSGSLNEGGSWLIIQSCAKREGMTWEVWDKLCRGYPKNYDFNKNKKKWEDLTDSDQLLRVGIEHILTMARGVYNEDTGEHTGDWKKCDELDGQFIQFEKFSRFYFNEICKKAKQDCKDLIEGGDDEIDDLEDELDDLIDEKKASKDSKRKKELRNEIKEKKMEIRELKKDGDLIGDLTKILDDCYSCCKKYFERFHFKIKFPECGYAISNLTDIYFLNKSKLKDLYENITIPILNQKGAMLDKEWFEMWKRDIQVRTIDVADFIPTPLPRQPYEFNLYRGLAGARLRRVKPIEEAKMLDIFATHITLLTGGEDADYRNEDTGLTPEQYMWYYLAHMVQQPGIIPEVGLIFCGEQGTGKSLFLEKFAEKILGRQYLLSTAHMNMVTGQFPQIQRKLVVIMDETQGKEGFANKDIIKNLITQPRICWEEKHKSGIMINNCARYWFISNNESPLCIELGDRRFVVFVCSAEIKRKPEREKTEYFNKLAAAFDDDAYCKALYDYLMKYDLKLPTKFQPCCNPKGDVKFHPKNNRPFTGRYCDIQSVNIPLPYYFFNNLVKIEGINMINKGDENESPELYQEEEMRIREEKTSLERADGTKIYCNQPKSFSRMELWEQYENYLDLIGKTNAKEWSDATKFWRKIMSWCDGRDDWKRAVELYEDDNGIKCCSIKPIEMRRLIEEFKHLLRV